MDTTLLLPSVQNAAVIGGITAAFGFLVYLVDSLVNNYGIQPITINNKKQLQVKGGSPLLFTLAEQGIFVPSACGGRGSCGACKCKVVTDVGPHLPTEIPYLTDGEIKQNIRLSCQVKVKGPISIEIPEELFYVKRFKTTVESIKSVTYDIKEVRFRLEKGQTIDFKAGQYAQIVIPPYGKIKESTQRAYSMSSKPSDKEHIELLIRLVPNGIATTYVHNYLHQGQHVELVGPFGDFHVRDTNATMLCIAGGSGMAPFKSILHDIAEKGNNKRPIWYFFGARAVRDLYYRDEMRELEKVIPNFHYIEALSDPLPEDKWEGELGLITDVLDRYIKNVIPAEEKKEMEGYLCGSPGMINACIRVMNNNGVTNDKIYYDSFA